MKVVDLTHEISPCIRVFPGSPQPAFIRWSKFDTHGYDSEVMFLSTHTGTHMDAPCHFTLNGESIDQIDVNRFICKDALLLKIEKETNELITRRDIMDCGVNIEKNDSIIFNTGWEKHYDKEENQKTEDYVMANPGLGEDASRFLVESKVNAVAIDSPSIDAGIDHNFISHKILLSNNVLVIENLCNLEKLSNGQRFTLIVTPLKLVHATGSPIRAIGIVE
ncbi:MAG: cyclase family protein [Candidatus Nitrosopolaris sp.]